MTLAKIARIAKAGKGEERLRIRTVNFLVFLAILAILARDILGRILLLSAAHPCFAFHSRTASSSASPGIGRPMK